MRTALVLSSLAAALALTTGAASREEPAASTGGSAEGFWVASLPDGVHVKWAILDGGETWGVYEAAGTVLGAFHGQTRSANGALEGSGQAYDIPSGNVGTARFTGSYLPRQAISLTTSFGVTLSGRYAPTYDEPASPAALTGRYDGEGLSSRRPLIALRMQVAGDGDFIMTSREDCAASGHITPRPGGRNIFDVSLHFAGAACPLGDGARASGIAHRSATSGELFMLAMNETRTDGWLFLGQRSGD